MGLKIGLDFGTSNSGVAISDGERVKLLPVDPQNVLPQVVKSILYIDRHHRHFIGQEAIELYYRHNVNRLRRYVKKLAGEIEYRGAEMYYVRDSYVYVDELKPGRLLQYLKTTLRKPVGSPVYSGTQVFDRYYEVADLIQAYLESLKIRAETLLGETVTAVTLGRPVKFSDDPALDHRAEETLRLAAHQAGFEQVDFELEPVAAALFYEKTLEKPRNTLIFDFGGGTLDLAIMRLVDSHRRKVYASGGINVAGSDFDRAIIEKRLLPHFGLGVVLQQPELMELILAVPDWIALPEMSTPETRQRLEAAIQSGMAPAKLARLKSLTFNDLAFSFYHQVEAAKIALSSQGSAVINLVSENFDLWELYTRNQFEADISEYRQKIETMLLDTVEASGLEPGEIDVVVKTGGSSNIPAFSHMLERMFGTEKVIASDTFSSVVSGLAIRASET
ncbi:MAG: Hsp70 family protein [Anaerolineales bacterium]